MNRRKAKPQTVLPIVLLLAQCAFAATPVHLDKKGEKWAASTLRRMTMEEKVGQMIMVWAQVQFLNVESPEYLRLRDEMRQYHVGGFGVTVATDFGALMKSQPLEAAQLTNTLQKDSKYPLLFAADFERGPSMRLNGTTPFPAAMAFGAAGDPELARQFGRISAEETRAIGIQWNWFPVADVNSNPANPIINTRSFGEDPTVVSKMVAAYIDGAHSGGLLTTVKHFPGHGDTDTDSHIGLARVNANMDRLNAVELVPFRNAIAAGVDSVMVGHITVPAIEPDLKLPASISSRVITGLLKEQMGFRGLVVTDALEMGALMSVFTGTDAEISAAQAVQAVQAGDDMVIIPADLEGAYNGLLDAVKQGKISKERIDESVRKILRMKASVGLNHNRFVDLSAASQEIARPASIAAAQQISDRAITLVLDANKIVPLKLSSIPSPQSSGVSNGERVVAILFAGAAHGSEGGRAFVHELRNRVPDAIVFYVDAENAGNISGEVLAAVKGATTVIAIAESVPTARRTIQGHTGGSVSMETGPSQILADLIKDAAAKTVLVAFGNPYIGEGIPGIQTYLCTYSNTTASASSLAAALFGENSIHGRLPVGIPGLAQRGAGLDREVVKAVKP
jgi:beta-N-acetylhexosaminidase